MTALLHLVLCLLIWCRRTVKEVAAASGRISCDDRAFGMKMVSRIASQGDTVVHDAGSLFHVLGGLLLRGRGAVEVASAAGCAERIFFGHWLFWMKVVVCILSEFLAILQNPTAFL
jgi:hypothetical protein